jgi:hypothetical protein
MNMTPRSEIAMPAHGMSRRLTANWSALDRLVEAIADREFVTVGGFCAIGLLLTATFVYCFPNLADAGAAFGLVP